MEFKMGTNGETRNYVRNCDLIFPEEHLGVADKLLLKQVVFEESEFFRKYNTNHRLGVSAAQHMAIVKRMKTDYGFQSPRFQILNGVWVP